VLKDLGIVGNDGKLNEDAMQYYAERLKKVVPSDLLNPLLGFKRTCILGYGGRGFFVFSVRVCLRCNCLAALVVSWLFSRSVLVSCSCC